MLRNPDPAWLVYSGYFQQRLIVFCAIMVHSRSYNGLKIFLDNVCLNFAGTFARGKVPN